MRKVIFLDVDGVLNSNETLGLSWRECLEKPLLKLLYKIVAKTNAKIVLSSAWRLQDEPRMLLHHTFKKMSASGSANIEIIGQTSEMNVRDVRDRKGKIDHESTAILSRAMEIKSYVEKSDFKGKGVRWIVIDDMDLGQDSDLRRRFIRTDPTVGLTAKHAVEAISKLNT